MNQFDEVFTALKRCLEPHAVHLVLKADTADNYYLNLHYTREDGYQGYFGSVQIKKNYVSYHLMAVYAFPEMLESVSDKLKKRMQGKSCFNFKKPEPELFAELEQLTKLGFERFKQEGFV